MTSCEYKFSGSCTTVIFRCKTYKVNGCSSWVLPGSDQGAKVPCCCPGCGYQRSASIHQGSHQPFPEGGCSYPENMAGALVGKQMAPLGGGAESCGGTAGPIRDTTEADGPGSRIAKVHGSIAVYGCPARPSERIPDSQNAAPRWTIPVHWPGSI